MKNVLLSTAMLLLSLAIVSCKKPNDLTPDGGAIPTMAGYESAPNETTAAMQVDGRTPKRILREISVGE